MQRLDRLSVETEQAIARKSAEVAEQKEARILAAIAEIEARTLTAIAEISADCRAIKEEEIARLSEVAALEREKIKRSLDHIK